MHHCDGMDRADQRFLQYLGVRGPWHHTPVGKTTAGPNGNSPGRDGSVPGIAHPVTRHGGAANPAVMDRQTWE